jgi:hypothetical protein
MHIVLRRFVAWLIEMAGDAFGTCLILIALAFWEATPGTRNDLSGRMILGISAVVLIEFAMTGYLVTTAMFGLGFRNRGRIFYPAISALLYLVHSSIFFVAVGNHLFDRRNLVIQISGACLAFACAFLGNRLLVRRAGQL